MIEPPDAQPKGGWRPAYHLIWALPLSLLASNVPLWVSAFIWCGISGCSGGGFGRIPDPDIPAAVSWLIAGGLVAAIPVAAVPWTRNLLLRFSATALFAAVVSVFGLKSMWP